MTFDITTYAALSAENIIGDGSAARDRAARAIASADLEPYRADLTAYLTSREWERERGTLGTGADDVSRIIGEPLSYQRTLVLFARWYVTHRLTTPPEVVPQGDSVPQYTFAELEAFERDQAPERWDPRRAEGWYPLARRFGAEVGYAEAGYRRDWMDREDPDWDSPRAVIRTGPTQSASFPRFVTWLREHEGMWSTASPVPAEAASVSVIPLADATALADAHPLNGRSNVAEVERILRGHSEEQQRAVRALMNEARTDPSSAAFRRQSDFGDWPFDSTLESHYVGRNHSIPALMAWARARRRGPFAVPQGDSGFTAAAAPQLPRSPRDAFPSLEAMHVAAVAWGRDRNEHGRLPEVMPLTPRDRASATTYTRQRIRNGAEFDFRNEMNSAWEENRFDYPGTSYARGFWRDVRELGYGTPYWGAVDKSGVTPTTVPAGMTAVPIGPDHPGWHEWWYRLHELAVANRYESYYDRLARSMGGPLNPTAPQPAAPAAPARYRPSARRGTSR